MKKILLPLLSFLILTGCMKEDLSIQSSAVPSQTMRKPVAVDVAKAMAELQQIEKADRARLATRSRMEKDCMKNIQVPRDYTTIQEAVDNACEDAVIIVHAGNYTEVVVVNKPGLKFKANGDVTLVGGFVLNAGADHVDIQQFTIVVGLNNVHAITARDVTGGKIFQNTISDPAHKGGTAIQFFNGNEVTVRGNHISGTGWGIFFGSTLVNGGSHNNTISNNYVTGIRLASVIGLQGNCDNNFINENILTDNPNLSNAGVMLFSGDAYGGHCDYNVVKQNQVTNAIVGTYLLGGSNNQIGPYNTLNENVIYGFVISQAATGNTIFDNTALENGNCDIVNVADEPLSNTFTNNTAGCTIGL